MLYTVKIYASGPNIVKQGKGIIQDKFKTDMFDLAKYEAFHITNEDSCYTVLIVNNETGNRIYYHNGNQV